MKIICRVKALVLVFIYIFITANIQPQKAYAATFTASNESSLKQAVANAHIGDTVTIMQNITLTSTLEISNSLNFKSGTGSNVSIFISVPLVNHVSVDASAAPITLSFDKVIFDGQNASGGFLIDGNAPDGSKGNLVTVDGLVIQNCLLDTADNSIVKRNYSAVTALRCELTLTNCKVLNNESKYTAYQVHTNGDGYSMFSRLVITNAPAGGIYYSPSRMSDGNRVKIIKCEVSGNKGVLHGGMSLNVGTHTYPVSGSITEFFYGDVLIQCTVIKNNTGQQVKRNLTGTPGYTHYASGGASIFGANTVIKNCLIEGNTSNEVGGILNAIYPTATGYEMKIEDSRIAFNTSSYETPRSDYAITNFLNPYAVNIFSGGVADNIFTYRSANGTYLKNNALIKLNKVEFEGNSTDGAQPGYGHAWNGNNSAHTANIISTGYSSPFANAYNGYDMQSIMIEPRPTYPILTVKHIDTNSQQIHPDEFINVQNGMSIDIKPMSYIDSNGIRYTPVSSPVTKTMTGAATEIFTYTASGTTPESFHITYNANGGIGTVPVDNNVYTGPIAVMGKGGLSRPGYNFNGWSMLPDGSGRVYTEGGECILPYKDVVLYAVWEPALHYLLFDYQGASGGNDLTNQAILGGQQPATLPSPTKTYHSFEGWFTGIDGTGTEYTTTTVYASDSDTQLYADWEGDPFKITFDYQGADSKNEINDITAIYGQAIGSLPSPAKTGFDLNGWYTQPDGQGKKYETTTVYQETSAITLYASWKASNKTKLTFDYQGATSPHVPAEKSVVYGQPIGTLPAPSRNGYSFSGWYSAPDAKGTLYTENTVYGSAGETVLYAAWSGNPYKISFDYQGADSKNDKTEIPVVYGQAVGDLPAPGRTGYVFTGWHEQSNGGGEKYEAASVYQETNDITLYANWAANGQTKLAFDYQGATSPHEPAEKAVLYDQPVGELPSPSRTGYSFSGWFTEPYSLGERYTAATVFNEPGTVELFAAWSGEKYNISFDYQGADSGNETQSKEATIGQALGDLPSPGKTGYVFNGWYQQQNGGGKKYNGSTLYGELTDITLYAFWTTSGQTIISFDYQLATSPHDPVQKNVLFGLPVGELPLPSRTGYNFTGWFTEPYSSGERYTSDTVFSEPGTVELFAAWSGESFNISFDYQGADSGNETPSKEATVGQALGDLPSPCKTGYVFSGWFTQANGGGEKYDSSTYYSELQDITLYAYWTTSGQTIISFDYQLATSPHEPAQKSLLYGLPVGELPLPSRTGYTFTGWFTEPYSSGIQYTSETVFNETGTVKLFAAWSGERHNIFFDYQGADSGNEMPSKEVTVGQALGDLPSPGKTGYVFSGWFTQANGSSEQYDSSTYYSELQDITLYAYWTTSGQTMLSFDYQLATSPHDPAQKNVLFGLPVGELPLPSRTGYTFTGWFTEPYSSGERYTSDTVFSEPGTVELFAAWSGERYNIFFDYQGADSGNEIPSKDATVGQALGDLPSPGKTGYVFSGWFTQANGGGEKYDSSTYYSELQDITLYAYWTTSGQTMLSFNYQLATSPHEPAQKNVLFGLPVGELPLPSRTGYTFTGWFTEPYSSGEQYTSETVFNAVGEVKLYAAWRGGNNVLSFDYQGADSGNEIQSKEVITGQALGDLPVPGKSGNIFKGWFAQPNGDGSEYNSLSIYDDIKLTSLYAVWNPEAKTAAAEKYKITYDYQGATGGATEQGKEIEFGESIGALPYPTKNGFGFNGWYTGQNGSGILYTSNTRYDVNTDLILFASWQPNTNRLMFHYQGGTNSLEGMYVLFGQPVGQLPTTVKQDYIFAGWFTIPDGKGVQYKADTVFNSYDTVNLYAYWESQGDEVKTFSVRYNLNDGTGSVPLDNSIYTMDDEVRLMPDTSISRAGYVFNGWSIFKDGSNSTYMPGHHFWISRNVTFYAVWVSAEGQVFRLTYNANGQTVDVPVDQQVYKMDDEVRVQALTHVISGKVFKGWCITPNGDDSTYQPGQHFYISRDITLYAIWS